MKKVLLKKDVDFSVIEDDLVLLKIVGLTKMVDPVGTCVPNACQNVSVDTALYIVKEGTRHP
jgi:hypothetical protein